MIIQKGFIVISATLVLLLVTIGITSMLLFLSTGGLKISESLRQGEQALFNSESCLEEGLKRFKADPLYNGGAVNFPEGTCHIDIEPEGEGFAFEVYYLNESRYKRGIEAIIEIVDGALIIKNWNEAMPVIE